MSTDYVTAARAEFPALQKGIYLQHAGLALFPDRGRRAVEETARRMADPSAWSGYREDREALCASLARLISADPEEITLTRGTGQGLSVAVRGLDWRPGDNVVSVRGEYPANVFPWSLLARAGVELRLAATCGGRVDPAALFALADQRTRVITVSWVQWWNGYRCNLTAISAECRRRGILLVVDAIQGIGALRLDARAAGADVLACGGSKWLLGMPGTGFCYIRAAVIDRFLPPLLGAGSVSVQPGVPFEDLTDLRPGAARFEESAVSWPDIAALRAGVSLIEEAGPEAVERRVLALSRRLGEGLAARGFRIVEPWPRSEAESSGIVAIQPRTQAAEAVQRLAEAGVTARLLRNAIRFSTHYFNTEDEVDAAIAAVEEHLEP